jgi:hypothetical protein
VRHPVQLPSDSPAVVRIAGVCRQSDNRNPCHPRAQAKFRALYFSGWNGSGQAFARRHAYYVQAGQLLLRENPWEEGDNQGLGAFARYSPDSATVSFRSPRSGEASLVALFTRGRFRAEMRTPLGRASRGPNSAEKAVSRKRPSKRTTRRSLRLG